MALEPGEAITVAAGKGFVLHALKLELLHLRDRSRGGGGGEAEAGLRRISSAATECGALRGARLAEATASSL